MFEKNMSLGDKIFVTLENDILTGKYRFGEILTEARLCEELGVSRTPVHEALVMLENEGLVADIGKGQEVRGITKSDIEDIMEIRLRIEGMAARLAAERMTEAEKEALTETLDLQEYYITKGDREKIQMQDHGFHEAIYNGCRSTSLSGTLSPLHRKAIKYRRKSISDNGRAVKSLEEHRAIAEAILRGDGAAAEAAMTEHIRHAAASILKLEAD